MIALGFVSIFIFFAALLLLAWFPLLLWRLIGNRRRAPVQPVCAICRYPTISVAQGRCPECGADLLRDGVLTPAMRVRQGGGVLLAVAAWTIILGIGAMLLASWVMFAIPVPTDLRVSTSGVPASGAYREFSLRGEVETSERFSFGGLGADGAANLTLTVFANDGTPHERTFIREKEEAFFRLDDGRVVDDFALSGTTTHDVVREVLVQAGAPADDASTDHEASEIANAITSGAPWWEYASGGAFTSTTNATLSRPKSEWVSAIASLAPVCVLLVAAGAWLAGTIILFNQHGKRFRPRPSRRDQSPEVAAETPSDLAV